MPKSFRNFDTKTRKIRIKLRSLAKTLFFAESKKEKLLGGIFVESVLPKFGA